MELCKCMPPNQTVTWWRAKVLVMRKREHDSYWAAVCYTGINGNPGIVGAAN